MPIRSLLLTLLLTSLLACWSDQKTANTNLPDTLANQAAVTLDSSGTGEDIAYENATRLLGIGLVFAPDTVTVYADSLLTGQFATVYGHSLGEAPPDWLRPLFYKPDYDILHFVCLKQTAKAYEVLTDGQAIRYLPRRRGYEYISWPAYLMQSHGVRRKDLEDGPPNQPLRRLPAINAKPVAVPSGLEMFCVMQVKGDLIQVRYDCFYNRDPNPHEGEPCSEYIQKCPATTQGWLRWRAKDKLLVDVFTMP